MRRSICYAAIATTCTLVTNIAVAQTPAAKVPIRVLGASTVVSKDSLSALIILRELSNGGVLISDLIKRNISLFDANLVRQKEVVLDSTKGTELKLGALPIGSMLIKYAGDSSLFVDRESQSLLVVDGNGKVARIMALPKPKDAMYMANFAYGQPAISPRGEIVYRGVIVPPAKPMKMPAPGEKFVFPDPEPPDSAPIVRASFDTRKVDTLARLKISNSARLTTEHNAGGKDVHVTIIDPLPTGDDWAMLSDGTVAVVRVHDYHIDWVDPNGTKRSTAKMPFDWRKLTDKEKQAKIDSAQQQYDKRTAASVARLGPNAVLPKYKMVSIDQLTDFEPPIVSGSVKADFSNNLWILPRTSASANGGLLYDVVNRLGEITYRVQFPKNYYLAGFGKDVVYVLRREGVWSFLERAKLP